jgi:hypothetical protein
MSLGNYEMPFGKNKGRKFSDLSLNEIWSYVKFIEGLPPKDDKGPSKAFLELKAKLGEYETAMGCKGETPARVKKPVGQGVGSGTEPAKVPVNDGFNDVAW